MSKVKPVTDAMGKPLKVGQTVAVSTTKQRKPHLNIEEISYIDKKYFQTKGKGRNKVHYINEERQATHLVIIK